MKSKPLDDTAKGSDRIADNSRHERERPDSGAEIVAVPALDITAIPDRMSVWMERYQTFAVAGNRSPAVAIKIALHLGRFRTFFEEAYGHDRLSVCLQRDVTAWQRALVALGLAPATVSNHLASLSAFTSWVYSVAPGLFPLGDPTKGVSELGLPPLEPRSLSEAQVRSPEESVRPTAQAGPQEGPPLGRPGEQAPCVSPTLAGSGARVPTSFNRPAARGSGAPQPRPGRAPHG
ncbi:MAG: hypothetical protein IPG72_10325 [Ardenticatenales bacterium]|nr:hypothetical protein [Ardenticatenales bacterium]